MTLLQITMLIVIALAAAGCNPGSAVSKTAEPVEAKAPALPSRAQPKLPTMTLYIGAHEIEAELALNDQQRQAGMMFRESMAENEGMLFVFPFPHRTSFWMKNTLLPLSAAYIDPDGVILEIHALTPHDTNSVVSASENIQYVLETNQGWFERHGIGVGTTLRTPRGTLRETFSIGRAN